MEYHIIDDDGRSHFTVVLAGEFDCHDLERCYLEMIHHHRWQAGKDVLWDVRRCTSDRLVSSDIRAIATMLHKYGEQRGRGKADYGMSRMFEMMNEATVVFQFRVFRDHNEADQFLRS